MARKIFIAATGMNSGKTTTSLSLMHMALRKYKKVGFIKPLGPKPVEFQGQIADKDAVLMARYFGLEDDLHLMSPFVLKGGDTRRVMDGELAREQIRNQVFGAIKELDEKNDFLIIEGAGHTGVGTVLGCNNAQIARTTGATVLLVTGGGLGNVIDTAQVNIALFQKEQARVKAILINKIIPDKREQTLKYLDMAFADEDIKVIGGFNYQPILANPSMRRIAGVLGVELRANHDQSQRIIHNVQIGAASAQRVVELLRESTLVIVNSSRDELLVTLSNLYHLDEFRPKIAGIVIPGSSEISHITMKIINSSGIPYMIAKRTSSKVFEMISDDVSKLTVEDTHKLKLLTELAEKRLKFEEIDALLDD
jgi:BioD-like phosphotransacetylase family protein